MTKLPPEPPCVAQAQAYSLLQVDAGAPAGSRLPQGRALTRQHPSPTASFPDGRHGMKHLLQRRTGAIQRAALIGLAVPGRPIGPWSRRTGAPKASATGRDRTLGPCWVRGAPGPQGHERSPTVTNGQEEPQVHEPPGQTARTTRTGRSDCGPEGRAACRYSHCCGREGLIGVAQGGTCSDEAK